MTVVMGLKRVRRPFVGMVVSLLLAQSCFASNTETEHLAIVVHPGTAIDELSSEEVSQIFRAEQQFWPDKHRITLLIRAPVSRERTVVLEQIYNMSEQEFRKYWISKMFKAEVASGPRVVYTSGMANSLVSAIPGAIAFIPLSSVPPGAKVLKINGQLPGEPGYLFTM